MDDTEKVAFLVQDAKANGLGVLAPDINRSQYRFEPVRGVDEQGLPQREPSERARAIRYGLGAVRGVGESAVQNILAAREQGPFRDLFDFCARVDRRVVNRRAMEALVKAGAFDALHPQGTRAGRAERAVLVSQIALACQAADDAEANAHQGGLFGDADPASLPTARLGQAQVQPYSPRETLLEEKTALGYCFSGSLFDSVAKELRRYAGTPLVRAVPSREPIWIAGVVVDSRAQMTKRGMMRVIALDDGSARMEVTVFNELFESRRSVLKVDEPLLVSARIDNDEFSGGLRGSAVEILTLTEVRLRHAKALAIRLQAQASDRAAREIIDRLRTAVAAARPPLASQACPVVVELHTGQEVCSMRLGPGFAISPSDENLSALAQAFGPDEVQLVYV
jgi:DNA polymerase-3 subunit alpha